MGCSLMLSTSTSLAQLHPPISLPVGPHPWPHAPAEQRTHRRHHNTNTHMCLLPAEAQAHSPTQQLHHIRARAELNHNHTHERPAKHTQSLTFAARPLSRLATAARTCTLSCSTCSRGRINRHRGHTHVLSRGLLRIMHGYYTRLLRALLPTLTWPEGAGLPLTAPSAGGACGPIPRSAGALAPPPSCPSSSPKHIPPKASPSPTAPPSNPHRHTHSYVPHPRQSLV